MLHADVKSHVVKGRKQPFCYLCERKDLNKNDKEDREIVIFIYGVYISKL